MSVRLKIELTSESGEMATIEFPDLTPEQAEVLSGKMLLLLRGVLSEEEPI